MKYLLGITRVVPTGPGEPAGFHGLFWETQITADGSLSVELTSVDQECLWRGSLRPLDQARRLVDDAGADELPRAEPPWSHLVKPEGAELGGAGVVDEAP